MKCTLRKVNEGIIATVDERPNKGDYYYSLNTTKIHKCKSDETWDNWQLILASTFGVGMELYVEYLGWGGLDKMEINKMEINSFIKVWDNDKNKYIDFDTQYEYRIESDKLIITL
jgi:hypothetical protein